MRHTLVFTSIFALTSQTFASVTYNGEIKAGAQYDSNVIVTEVNRASNQADVASYLRGKLNAHWKVTPLLSINAGINHQHTQYQDASDFDLAITTWNIGAGWQTHSGKWGVHSYQAKATLDRNAFMQYQQSGVSWQNSMSTKTYLHISADYVSKRFETTPERDAQGGQLSTQWFYMPDANGEMLNIGYSYLFENANLDRLDFHGHTGQLNWTYPTLWGETALSLKAQYQFVIRDYKEAEAFMSVTQRTDRQHSLSVMASYNFVDNVTFDVGAKYADYQSNLSIADYQESQANVGVTITF